MEYNCITTIKQRLVLNGVSNYLCSGPDILFEIPEILSDKIIFKINEKIPIKIAKTFADAEISRSRVLLRGKKIMGSDTTLISCGGLVFDIRDKNVQLSNHVMILLG